MAECNGLLIEFELPIVLLENGFVPSLLEGFVWMRVVPEVDVELGELGPQGPVRLALLVELSEQDDVLKLFEEQVEDRVIVVLYLGEGAGQGD